MDAAGDGALDGFEDYAGGVVPGHGVDFDVYVVLGVVDEFGHAVHGHVVVRPERGDGRFQRRVAGECAVEAHDGGGLAA